VLSLYKVINVKLLEGTAHTLQVLVVFLLGFAGAEKDVVYNHVARKCNDCYAETREHATENGCSGEDGVLSPGVTFGPRISIKGKIGHSVEVYERKKGKQRMRN